MEGIDLSRDWPLISGVTEACLKRVGKLPSAKERFARCAIISENTRLQRKRREVGIMSIVDDLAGEELRTRVTSIVTMIRFLRCYILQHVHMFRKGRLPSSNTIGMTN